MSKARGRRSRKWVHAIGLGNLDARGKQGGQISIVPRAEASVTTLQLPQEERFLNQGRTLKVRSPTCCEASSLRRSWSGEVYHLGAANDCSAATTCQQMVGTYGRMSDTLGPLAYDKQMGAIRFLAAAPTARY